ncbi:MAG: hypothetical protein M0Z53_16565 [Thermaerobacter sp.]|nr:hypothetical protein [Thermaerobacter sp.]
MSKTFWFVLGGLLGAMFTIAAHSPIPLLTVMYFVPGATLVYYLRDRQLGLRRGHTWIAPALLSLVASIVLSQANSLLLFHTASALSWSHGTTTAGLAWLFSLFAIVLLECVSPDMVSPSWRISPVTQRFLAYLLPLAAAPAGIATLAHANWPLLILLLAGLAIAHGLYHRPLVATPAPDRLLRYSASYAAIMVAALLSVYRWRF